MLLFLFTGSVVLPAKALVLNVLSLATVLGAMVWIFQDGHLSGMLNDLRSGHIETIVAWHTDRLHRSNIEGYSER